uniref:Reverse transcriptase n=1 Tax=Romanomermis culicivorax TaxID=13658 RepID=A0A915JGC5_ROMCU
MPISYQMSYGDDVQEISTAQQLATVVSKGCKMLDVTKAKCLLCHCTMPNTSKSLPVNVSGLPSRKRTLPQDQMENDPIVTEKSPNFSTRLDIVEKKVEWMDQILRKSAARIFNFRLDMIPIDLAMDKA